MTTEDSTGNPDEFSTTPSNSTPSVDLPIIPSINNDTDLGKETKINPGTAGMRLKTQ